MVDVSFGLGVILATLTISGSGPEKAEYETATRAALSESYRRSGMENKLRKWEETHITPEARWWLGNGAILVRVVTEHQVVFKWDF